MKKVLTIAGSDSSGGAGIQADLKTITVHGMYGMSVITALTAQNTMGITGVWKVPAEFVKKQLEAVFDDIFPDAVKIGMIPDAEVMEAVTETLQRYGAKNIVIDTVLSSTSGTALSEEGAENIRNKLYSMSTVITPNVPEAIKLSGLKITTKEEATEAAVFLSKKYGCNVLLKGGHLEVQDKASDCLFLEKGESLWFDENRIINPNTHGTGCTLSSAIACNLADGKDIKEAVLGAKQYITKCINAGLDIGKGRGPLDHTVFGFFTEKR